MQARRTPAPPRRARPLLTGLALLLAAPAACWAQAQAEPLFVLCADPHCALVDAQGQPVTPRRFDGLDADAALSGAPFIRYTRLSRQGAIDRRGRTVVPPRYEAVFGHGEALLSAYDGAALVLYDGQGRRLDSPTGSSAEVWPAGPQGRGWLRSPAGDDCPVRLLAWATGQTERCLSSFLALDHTPPRAVIGLPQSAGTVPRVALVDGALNPLTESPLAGLRMAPSGLAKVVDAQARVGVVDADGRTIVPPGRYAELFVPHAADDGWIHAYADGERNCPDAIAARGQRLPLPAGWCPSSTARAQTLGYVTASGPDGRQGVVALDGRLLAPAVHPRLRPVNAQQLIEREGEGSALREGLIDVHGRRLLPTTFAGLQAVGPDGRAYIATRAEGGTGLIAPDGRWLVPPEHTGGTPVTAHIVALRGTDGVHTLWRSDGTPLNLRTPSPPSPPAASGAAVAYQDADAAPAARWGLLTHDGGARLPAAYTELRREAAAGLWRARLPDGQLALFDDAARLQRAPAPLRALLSPVRAQVAVAETPTGAPLLIHLDGRTLARASDLNPEPDGQQEPGPDWRALRYPCRALDPAAEPGEPPPLPPALCASAPLRAAPHAAQDAWLRAMGAQLHGPLALQQRNAAQPVLADPALLAAPTEADRLARLAALRAQWQAPQPAAPAAPLLQGPATRPPPGDADPTGRWQAVRLPGLRGPLRLHTIPALDRAPPFVRLRRAAPGGGWHARVDATGTLRVSPQWHGGVPMLIVTNRWAGRSGDTTLLGWTGDRYAPLWACLTAPPQQGLAACSAPPPTQDTP